MSEYAVVVVDAETPGNVGTIARAMKNFGVSQLLLVDPPPIEEGSEAYGFAGHAREDVLPNAREVTLETVTEQFHTVGFTAITAEDARSHTRFPYTTPAELRESLAAVEADTALVFGREDQGLSNEELAMLDQVAAIPANPEYPVMNLGQAVNVVLYELRELFLSETHLPDRTRERAEEAEIERFYEQFDRFLSVAEHREFRRDRANELIRRLLGRTHPTHREITTLTGLFRKTANRLAAAPPSVDGADTPASADGTDTTAADGATRDGDEAASGSGMGNPTDTGEVSEQELGDAVEWFDGDDPDARTDESD